MGIVTPVVTGAGQRRDFSLITAAYGDLLGGATGVAILGLWNTTNEDLYFSLNAASSDSLLIPAGAFWEVNFGANGLNYNGTIAVKSRTATAPTSGAAYASIIARV